MDYLEQLEQLVIELHYDNTLAGFDYRQKNPKMAKMIEATYLLVQARRSKIPANG